MLGIPKHPSAPAHPACSPAFPRENQEARRLGPGTDCHHFRTRSQQLGNRPSKGAVPGCHVPPTHRPGPTWELRSQSPLGSGLLSMWLVTRRPRWSRGALMTGSSHEEGTHRHTRPCEGAGAMLPHPAGRQGCRQPRRPGKRRTPPLPPTRRPPEAHSPAHTAILDLWPPGP